MMSDECMVGAVCLQLFEHLYTFFVCSDNHAMQRPPNISTHHCLKRAADNALIVLTWFVNQKKTITKQQILFTETYLALPTQHKLYFYRKRFLFFQLRHREAVRQPVHAKTVWCVVMVESKGIHANIIREYNPSYSPRSLSYTAEVNTLLCLEPLPVPNM
jgi:hypothetical protein